MSQPLGNIDTADDSALETIELVRTSALGPWLLELGSADGTRNVLLRVGERITLGSGRYADVRLEDRAVSGRHCRLCATERGIEVEDLNSKNGLFIGSARVKSATLARGGASFVIGETTVAVRTGDDLESAAAEVDPIKGLVGASAPMRRVAIEVRRHARRHAPVLIQGESGTGKDVVARALHELSGRTGAYVPINAGAIPESLADAELFGYRRGAFTGAVAAHVGAFEQAHHGTLFLDEVAELSVATQVKLLRVVEDKCVRALGTSQAMRVNVRLISATWAELRDRAAQGQFRADLYHRLSTVIISLPPLRERISDIPALVRVLLARMRKDVGDKDLEPRALALLSSYSWPGNVRELSSVLYRAALASDGPRIEVSHIVIPNHDGKLAAPDRVAIDAVNLLKRYGGNVSAAARAARVPRTTFRGWLSRASSCHIQK